MVGKDIGTVKLVCSGAGAAALACLNILVRLGLKRENVTVCDIEGVVYEGATKLMDEYKAPYARKTNARTLGQVIEGADVFLGLSAPGVLTAEMVAKMGDKPIVMALANPVPEILPEVVKSVRADAVIATGRSDYPNQVNNVLVFPYIFRGALDVGASTINEAMKLAAVHALAELAYAGTDDRAAAAYGDQQLSFGPDYLIPKPFDRRLILKIAPAVARAAMESGVATRPIADFDAYLERLSGFVFRSGLVMKPIFDRAKAAPKRVVFAEGELRNVLRAVQTVVDEGLAMPIIIGRRAVVNNRIKELDLRIRVGEHVELCDPEDDPRYPEYWRLYHSLLCRRGISPEEAKTVVRTNNTVIAALMVHRGEANAMVCGAAGTYLKHLPHVTDIVGLRPGVDKPSALTLLILDKGTYFISDTHVSAEPSAAELVEQTELAVEEVRRFGVTPKVALLSYSNFGNRPGTSSARVREALAELQRRFPELEVEGEMHGDAAISEEIRSRVFPNSRLKGTANLLIMPSLNAANISFNLLKTLGEGLSVGPMLLGVAQPAHIVTESVTVRGLVNITALAVVDAQTSASRPAS